MLIPEKKTFLPYDKVSTSYVTKCLMAEKGQSVENLDKVSKRENVGGRAREARGASSQNVEGGRGARPGVKAGRAKPALSERSERREGWMEDKRAKPALSERSERREGWVDGEAQL
ncbi:hypothetical protein GPALN_003009 [Globodera pallida]|nr:hypothetical protein GPALN_003008 [Globodera pallida]KAI3410927.1 hypothetical protein GPALN_003009 [Globodera pallida]